MPFSWSFNPFRASAHTKSFQGHMLFAHFERKAIHLSRKAKVSVSIALPCFPLSDTSAQVQIPTASPLSQYHSQGMGALSSAKSVRGQNSWVLTNQISHQTDKMHVEKLELFSKFLWTSTSIWELWWGGRGTGRREQQVSYLQDNPNFEAAALVQDTSLCRPGCPVCPSQWRCWWPWFLQGNPVRSWSPQIPRGWAKQAVRPASPSALLR